MKIVYEFSEEDEDLLKTFQRAADFRSALWEIDDVLRSIGKHEEVPIEGFEEWFMELKDRLRGIVADTGIHEI